VESTAASALYIRLYIDEHVWRRLAAQLRERGFDAVNVYEVDRGGLSDEEQWRYAAAQGRAILTFDKDGGRFVKLASDWFYFTPNILPTMPTTLSPMDFAERVGFGACLGLAGRLLAGRSGRRRAARRLIRAQWGRLLEVVLR